MPTLTLPPGPFAAYLFDLDGTVADTMPIHYRCWSAAAAEQGAQFPEELFYSWGGIPLPRVVELLNERFGYALDPHRTADRKEELYLKLLPEVAAIPEVLAHIEAEHGRIPFAIVSGSPRHTILETLGYLGIADKFQAIVGAEDYVHGKPHPEPFLTAAARLGVEPGRCLVFEDAPAGIEAAEAAGMQWVHVPSPFVSTPGR